MFKEFILPFDSPPPFDPEVGFSPKLEQLRNLLRDYNRLSLLEKRLSFEDLVDVLELKKPALRPRLSVLKEIYPYMEPMVFASPSHWLMSIQLSSVSDKSLVLQAEYQHKGF